MALNDVLNRPLFRQQALKKGALKPIHAQTGVMVGPPVMGSTNPMNPRTQVPALRPNIFRRAVGDVRAFAQRPGQFFSPKTGRFVPGVGTAGLIATGGLAPIVGMGRRKLGISDESAFAPIIDYGIGGLLSINPFFRAAGMALQAGRVGLGALDYVKNQPIGTTREAMVPQNLGAPLGLFDPIDPSKPRGRGAIKKQREQQKALAKAAAGEGSEVALTGNVKPDALVATGKEELGTGQNKTDVIDITKVASNNAQVPESTIGNLENLTKGPTPLKIGEIASKPVAPVQEPDKKKSAGQTDANLQQDTNALDDNFKKSIAKARLIKEELMEGQTSNAKLVFLANLAQGLLTGTTRKQGVGGALEVFGNAIGPATTNYATMKLKENELENNLMGDALELVSEENKSRNQASKLPKIKQFGVIQIQDANNQARNVVGVQYENGTFGVATGQFDQFGREIFQPVPANAVNKFIEHSKGQSERDKTIRDLSGKYKAYQIGLSSINILKTDDVTGGPVGRINLFSKRLGDALSDFGIGFLSREEGKAKIKELKDQYIQQYMKDNNVEEDVARKVFEDTFGKGDSYLKKTLKQLGAFKGTGADLEQLAINETILTYALANSLKSKDRLTQKDIQMAAKLVNVFPLLRGEKSVIEALEAVNNTLIKDIQAAEFDYINAFGGDNRTIDNYRKRYGITTTEQAPRIANPYADKTTKDLLKEY